MKKILSILSIWLFIANTDANAQCKCTGTTNTETVHDAITGDWLYTITYQGVRGGPVCFVSASANPLVYRGDLPLHLMIYHLLNSNKITSMAIPAGCYSGKTVPSGQFDMGHQGLITIFTACTPGCCIVDINDFDANGNTPASGAENCPGGCHAICMRP